MKTLRATSGPFKERPHYELREIELICRDELDTVGLLPGDPCPIRIDRFIEKRFGVVPEYEDLSSGVLGYTRFGARGAERIVLSMALSEEGTAASERRVRTTLAHEAGHILLHGHLFMLGESPKSLFEEDADGDPTRILCRNEAVTGLQAKGQRLYDRRWWEYQANRAIGALLLPKPLVAKCLDGLLVHRGSLGLKALDESRREEAARILAETFNVNPVVARLRLGEVHPGGQEGQLSL